jgi:II/X family phage/plasmid replication protein
MIDKLELRIPFKPDVCIFSPDHSSATLTGFDKYILNDGLETRSTRTSDETGGIISTYENHAYESLASSYSGVAFCISSKGNGGYPFPHVMLKCSPAKILQGHNVYGSENPKTGFLEMIGILLEKYPTVFNDLDVMNSELMQIDCTYHSRFENQHLAEQCIKALSTTSNGQIKGRGNYETSVYWNSAGGNSSKGGSHIVRVAYLKLPEVLKEIEELRKIKDKNNFLHLNPEIQNSTNKRLYALNSVKDYCVGMVRFEGRIKARKLRDCGIPTNMVKFIEYCFVRNESTIQDLWHLAFDKIFEAFDGLTIMKTDDKTILETIDAKLISVSANGRINRRRAASARGFYFELKSMGYEFVKRNTAPQTFYDRVNSLLECGLNKAFIQAIENNISNVVPLIREISINFGTQTPANFEEPELRVAAGMDVFTGSFIKNQLPKTNLRLI